MTVQALVKRIETLTKKIPKPRLKATQLKLPDVKRMMEHLVAGYVTQQ